MRGIGGYSFWPDQIVFDFQSSSFDEPVGYRDSAVVAKCLDESLVTFWPTWPLSQHTIDFKEGGSELFEK